jgi:hypothetical protein
MTTPDFNDLTPPNQELETWSPPAQKAIIHAYRDGARHGYEQARQLWPEPITDRSPTEADKDRMGWVMILSAGVWRPWNGDQVGDQPWLHTPRWQPRQPTLKEQALEDVDYLAERSFGGDLLQRLNRIRRALEQAGEAQP